MSTVGRITSLTKALEIYENWEEDDSDESSALEDPDNCLSDDIKNMFRSAQDSKLKGNQNAWRERFSRACELFRDISEEEGPEFSFFYKLPERAAVRSYYINAYKDIIEKLGKAMEDGKDLKKGDLLSYISNLKNFENNEDNQATQDTKYKILLRLREIINDSETEEDEAISFSDLVRYVFNSDGALSSNEIVLMASNDFFKIKDVDLALQNGTIYAPGGDDKHNWGVNLVWLLAITNNRCPIRILSDLNIENGFHSKIEIISNEDWPNAYQELMRGQKKDKILVRKDENHHLTRYAYVENTNSNNTNVPVDQHLFKGALNGISITDKNYRSKILTNIIQKQGNNIPAVNYQDSSDSSAFALEIAVAIKMGYKLGIGPEGKPVLDPTERLDDEIRAKIKETTGVPGVGIIPTRQEQAKLYLDVLKEWENLQGSLSNTLSDFSSSSSTPSQYNNNNNTALPLPAGKIKVTGPTPSNLKASSLSSSTNVPMLFSAAASSIYQGLKPSVSSSSSSSPLINNTLQNENPAVNNQQQKPLPGQKIPVKGIPPTSLLRKK